MKRIMNKAGFTLIEIIGVLAVISVLAALVAPKVFETIAQSKATALASDIRTYQSAIQDWYADIGTLKVLSTAGVEVTPTQSCTTVVTTAPATVNGDDLGRQLVGKEANSGSLWNRWRGPYLDSIKSTSIGAVGPIVVCTGTAATTATNNTADFSLNPTAGNSSVNGKTVAYIAFKGVSTIDWNRMEAIVDAGSTSTGLAGSTAGDAKQGKVKFDGASGADGTMLIYLDSTF